MKRIGIYHFQYKVGGCKICYQHYINGMLKDFEQCHTVAQRIYGKDIEFYKNVRAKGLDFITMEHGKDAMKYIDAFIEKRNSDS